MKRTILVKTTGIVRTAPHADPVMAPISLIREPWHTDTPPPREHQRPTEPPMYARRASFGASGATQPDWRKA
jgi:hypothetical protein